jgi:hypothetical protein
VGGKAAVKRIIQDAIIRTPPTHKIAGQHQSRPFAQSGQQSGQTPMSSTNQSTSIPVGNIVSSSAGPVTSPGAPSNIHTLQIPASEHVLLAVRRGNDLDLVQIKKDSCLSDGDLFAQLKKAYLSKRGLWRRVLGLRIYSHCEFVEVSHIQSNLLRGCTLAQLVRICVTTLRFKHVSRSKSDF